MVSQAILDLLPLSSSMQELLGHASTRNGLLSILKNSRERAPTCNFTILWYPELLTAGRVTFARSLWKKLFNYLTEGRLSVKLKLDIQNTLLFR